jgi:chloramphenicol-sensitive protein RarD
MQLSGRGVGLSLIASVLFVLIPGYVRELAPLDGVQVFAQRVLWSIPMVLLLVLLTRQWAVLGAVLQRLRREPRLLAALPLAATLMGVQWALFVWAPLAGRMLEISLGYFLLPLAMVLVGRLFYGERLRPLQTLAVVCAVLGVAHELWLTRAFSWVTLLAALGYPPYFMLRRWMRLDALSGFILEMLMLAPLAIWLITSAGLPDVFTRAPQLWWLLPGLGLLSTLAFGAMMASSRLLPLGLFGILSYVEPVLLFAVSVLVLGEHFNPAQLWTYLPIWLAVLLIGWDSARLLRRQARQGL